MPHRPRTLGPQRVRIAAPRELVFSVIEGPYRRTPRAMAHKLEVLEHHDDRVLAAHHTPIWGGRRRVTTTEWVTFLPPGRITFELVKGPVATVTEAYDLTETGGETELVYTGELGTRGGPLGALWGAQVAKTWEKTVAASLADAKAESERRAR